MGHSTTIALDFKSLHLDTIKKNLKEVTTIAGNMKLPDKVINQLNDLTQSINAMEASTKSLNQTKVDASQFKELTKQFQGLDERVSVLEKIIKTIGEGGDTNPLINKLSEIKETASQTTSALQEMNDAVQQATSPKVQSNNKSLESYQKQLKLVKELQEIITRSGDGKKQIKGILTKDELDAASNAKLLKMITEQNIEAKKAASILRNATKGNIWDESKVKEATIQYEKAYINIEKIYEKYEKLNGEGSLQKVIGKNGNEIDVDKIIEPTETFFTEYRKLLEKQIGLIESKIQEMGTQAAESITDATDQIEKAAEKAQKKVKKKTQTSKVEEQKSNEAGDLEFGDTQYTKNSKQQIKIPLRITEEEYKSLKDRVSTILAEIQEEIKPLEVSVALVSGYKTRKTDELAAQLTKSLENGIKNKATKEKVEGLIETLQKAFNKELHLHFETEGSAKATEVVRNVIEECQEIANKKDSKIFFNVDAKLSDDTLNNIKKQLDSIDWQPIRIDLKKTAKGKDTKDGKALTKEYTPLALIEQAVKRITDAIKNKTDAFQDEVEAVKGGAGAEITYLSPLVEMFTKIKDVLGEISQLSGTLGDIHFTIDGDNLKELVNAASVVSAITSSNIGQQTVPAINANVNNTVTSNTTKEILDQAEAHEKVNEQLDEEQNQIEDISVELGKESKQVQTLFKQLLKLQGVATETEYLKGEFGEEFLDAQLMAEEFGNELEEISEKYSNLSSFKMDDIIRLDDSGILDLAKRLIDSTKAQEQSTGNALNNLNKMVTTAEKLERPIESQTRNIERQEKIIERASKKGKLASTSLYGDERKLPVTDRVYSSLFQTANVRDTVKDDDSKKIKNQQANKEIANQVLNLIKSYTETGEKTYLENIKKLISSSTMPSAIKTSVKKSIEEIQKAAVQKVDEVVSETKKTETPKKMKTISLNKGQYKEWYWQNGPFSDKSTYDSNFNKHWEGLVKEGKAKKGGGKYGNAWTIQVQVEDTGPETVVQNLDKVKKKEEQITKQSVEASKKKVDAKQKEVAVSKQATSNSDNAISEENKALIKEADSITNNIRQKKLAKISNEELADSYKRLVEITNSLKGKISDDRYAAFVNNNEIIQKEIAKRESSKEKEPVKEINKYAEKTNEELQNSIKYEEKWLERCKEGSEAYKKRKQTIEEIEKELVSRVAKQQSKASDVSSNTNKPKDYTSILSSLQKRFDTEGYDPKKLQEIHTEIKNIQNEIDITNEHFAEFGDLAMQTKDALNKMGYGLVEGEWREMPELKENLAGQEKSIESSEQSQVQKEVKENLEETSKFAGKTNEELQQCLATEEKWLAKCKDGSDAYNRRKANIEEINALLSASTPLDKNNLSSESTKSVQEQNNLQKELKETEQQAKKTSFAIKEIKVWIKDENKEAYGTELVPQQYADLVNGKVFQNRKDFEYTAMALSRTSKFAYEHGLAAPKDLTDAIKKIETLEDYNQLLEKKNQLEKQSDKASDLSKSIPDFKNFEELKDYLDKLDLVKLKEEELFELSKKANTISLNAFNQDELKDQLQTLDIITKEIHKRGYEPDNVLAGTWKKSEQVTEALKEEEEQAKATAEAERELAEARKEVSFKSIEGSKLYNRYIQAGFSEVLENGTVKDTEGKYSDETKRYIKKRFHDVIEPVFDYLQYGLVESLDEVEKLLSTEAFKDFPQEYSDMISKWIKAEREYRSANPDLDFFTEDLNLVLEGKKKLLASYKESLAGAQQTIAHDSKENPNHEIYSLSTRFDHEFDRLYGDGKTIGQRLEAARKEVEIRERQIKETEKEIVTLEKQIAAQKELNNVRDKRDRGGRPDASKYSQEEINKIDQQINTDLTKQKYVEKTEEELKECLATEEKWLAKCKEGSEAYNKRKKNIEAITSLLKTQNQQSQTDIANKRNSSDLSKYFKDNNITFDRFEDNKLNKAISDKFVQLRQKYTDGLIDEKQAAKELGEEYERLKQKQDNVSKNVTKPAKQVKEGIQEANERIYSSLGEFTRTGVPRELKEILADIDTVNEHIEIAKKKGRNIASNNASIYLKRRSDIKNGKDIDVAMKSTYMDFASQRTNDFWIGHEEDTLALLKEELKTRLEISKVKKPEEYEDYINAEKIKERNNKILRAISLSNHDKDKKGIISFSGLEDEIKLTDEYSEALKRLGYRIEKIYSVKPGSRFANPESRIDIVPIDDKAITDLKQAEKVLEDFGSTNFISEDVKEKVKEDSEELVKTAQKATADAQKSSSPSKVAMKLGEYWGIGYAEGIKLHEKDVEKNIRELVNNGTLTAKDLIDSNLEKELRPATTNILESIKQYPEEQLESGFQRIKKKLGEYGNFNLSKKEDKQVLHDWVDQYIKYQNHGGKRYINELTDNKKALEKITKEYEKQTGLKAELIDKEKLQNTHQTQAQIKAAKESARAVKEEGESADKAEKSFKKASNSKKEFKNRNKEVKDSATESAEAILDEAKAAAEAEGAFNGDGLYRNQKGIVGDGAWSYEEDLGYGQTKKYQMYDDLEVSSSIKTDFEKLSNIIYSLDKGILQLRHDIAEMDGRVDTTHAQNQLNEMLTILDEAEKRMTTYLNSPDYVPSTGHSQKFSQERNRRLTIESERLAQKAQTSYDKDQLAAIEQNNKRDAQEATRYNKEVLNSYNKLSSSIEDYIRLKIKNSSIGLTDAVEIDKLNSLEKTFYDAASGSEEFSANVKGAADQLQRISEEKNTISSFLNDFNEALAGHPNNNNNSILKNLGIEFAEKYAKELPSLERIFNKGRLTENLSSELNEIIVTIREINRNGLDLNTKKGIDDVQKLESLLQDFHSKNKLSEYIKATENQVEKLRLKIANFTEINSGMGNKFKKQFDELFSVLSSDGEKSIETIQELSTAFVALEAEVTKAGKLGKGTWRSFKDAIATQTTQFLARYFSLQDMIRYARTAFETIHQLDTALVDLKKTTTMSNSDLEEFYLNSAKIAKQTGVTTQEIISQAAAWSRLGYSSKETAESMSELSSKFAKISPGTSVEDATDYLVSTMKAKNCLDI